MKMETNANEMNDASEKKPIAVLGAGRLAAMLWRSYVGRCKWLYRFSIFRVNRRSGRVTHYFTSRDIADFAKLVQMLASAISEDGCLERDLRDDLHCLASCLADVLGTEDRGYVAPPTPTQGVRDVLKDVIRRYWEDAAHEFQDIPVSFHVYRKLVFVDRWLDGAVQPDERLAETMDVLVEHPHGSCPICGKNDGYLNFLRFHWFVCHAHQTRWLAGSNVFSTWKDETREQWDENWKKIQQYRIVVPWLPLTASTEASA